MGQNHWLGFVFIEGNLDSSYHHDLGNINPLFNEFLKRHRKVTTKRLVWIPKKSYNEKNVKDTNNLRLTIYNEGNRKIEKVRRNEVETIDIDRDPDIIVEVPALEKLEPNSKDELET